MKNYDVYAKFVGALEEKIPKKTKLAGFLAETLNIEKESAYRRLRSDIQFSFREIFLLANTMNISLDKIARGAIAENQSKILLEMSTPGDLSGEKANGMIELAFDFYTQLVAQSYSEMAMALSGISFSLYQSNSLLSRFYSLKYAYHNGNPTIRIPFGEIIETKKQLEVREKFSGLYHQIKNTAYIWDNKIIPVLVNDIRYFQNIHLLRKEEKDALKEELFRFLNNLEQLATDGEFKDTGNKFELYISDIDIDNTYGCAWSEQVYISFHKAFIFMATISKDASVYKNVSDWIKSIKKCSVCISVINDKERTLFFDKQREIVNIL
ncbi:hypothetical protein FACS189423_06770 [Bacteroidia bacterium]|nr:hypothetical protein FACS189423_06770 [Bacteroidia bacterium]